MADAVRASMSIPFFFRPVPLTSAAKVTSTLLDVHSLRAARAGALSCLVVFALFMAYFGLYSRHRLVANSPDEEFAALAAAGKELQ